MGSCGRADPQWGTSVPGFFGPVPKFAGVVFSSVGQRACRVGHAAPGLCFSVAKDKQPLHVRKVGQMTRRTILKGTLKMLGAPKHCVEGLPLGRVKKHPTRGSFEGALCPWWKQ